MRHSSYKAVLLAAAIGSASPTAPANAGSKSDQSPQWTSLFNGKDLTHWDTWLGRPRKTDVGLDVPKDKDGNYLQAIGLNKDPRGVYTVVQEDGRPAIRISGELWGGLTSQADFDNFHLKLQFKWGKKKWPPRLDVVRDSGILYYAVGPHGANGPHQEWMRSLECQVQETDVGDFHSVDRAIIDVRGTVDKRWTNDKGQVNYKLKYDPTGRTFAAPGSGASGHVVKASDHERSSGQWNTVEVLCVRGNCVHVVNGQPNFALRNARHEVGGEVIPLRSGKLQIQSEGAEVFYRDIQIRPIKRLPKRLRQLVR